MMTNLKKIRSYIPRKSMVIRSMSQISDAKQDVKLDLVSWRVAVVHFVACTAVELSIFHQEAQDLRVDTHLHLPTLPSMKHLLFLSLLGLTAASHSCDIAGQVRHRSLNSRTRSLASSLPNLCARTQDPGQSHPDGAACEV